MNGIFPALLTPFDDNGRINDPVLCALVERNICQGVDGFYVCGSTAEAFLLSLDERKHLLELVVSQVKSRCTIIAHIGCIGLDHALSLARHAASCRVDALSSVPPFYYSFTFAEIRDYYCRIADETGLPVLIYYIPALSGVSFSLEQLAFFMNDERFLGIKYTSTDFYLLERLKSLFPSKVIFNGYDEAFLAGLSMGADGGIGSTFNFMADKFIRIRTLFAAGKITEARQIQTDVNQIITALIKVGVIPGEKAVLDLLGLNFGHCRKPFKILSAGERAELYRQVSDLLVAQESPSG
jgi:N-acetylneuraminate lyase